MSSIPLFLRIRKKPDLNETGTHNEGMESPIRESNTEFQSRHFSSKKKRVKVVSSSDSER